jgi:hypothetical protein
MSHRSFLLRVAPVLAGALWFTVAAAAQTGVAAGPVPRTADGHPDMDGTWTNVTITPLERPKELAGKEFFTPAEALAYEKETRTKRNRDQRQRGTVADVTNAYNDFWWDSGTKVVKTLRTSMIIDPPDGRLPAWTPERRKQLQARVDAVKARCAKPGCEEENSGLLGPADGPEDRPLMERCLAFGTIGPPMMPSAYNNNYQIVQTPGFIAIEAEMVHDTRRILLDGSPHLPASVRQWKGDSRAHWDGDTLVIDTTNFTGETRFRGSDENLHLTERLTMVDKDTIMYRFTVDDPTAFVRPWTAEYPLVREDGLIYEYACHEGNMGLVGILDAARTDEAKAAAKAAGN